jgi:hypothetical protein
MTKTHFRRFQKHVFGEDICERSLLLVDSWPGHEGQETVKFTVRSRNVDVLLVAKRTTKCVQSHHVAFLWQYYIT